MNIALYLFAPLLCLLVTSSSAQQLPTASLPQSKATRDSSAAKRYAAELQQQHPIDVRTAPKSIDLIKADTKSLNSLYGVETATINSLDASAPSPQDVASPWEKFAFALTQQIQGTAQWKGIQLASVPLMASWNDPKYGNFTAWHVIGDTIPRWGPNYGSTDEQVSRGYKIFLDNIDITPPNPALAKKAADARKEYDKAVGAQADATAGAGDDWKDFSRRQANIPVPNQLSYESWYQQFEGPRLAGFIDAVNTAGQAYTSLLNQAGGGYAWAGNLLIDYNNPAFQALAQSPDGKVQLLRTYNITPDLQSFIDTSKGIATGSPDALNMSMDSHSGSQDISNTSWSGSASYFGGFFGFGASASGGTTTVDTKNASFSMNFGARNIAVFTIQPGPWFNGTAVRALQNGPFIKGGPVQDGTTKLWGPNGALRLVVTQILVAFRPKVSATLSESDYNYVHSHFNTSGGFSVGPFGFGASYGRDNTDIKWDDAKRSFTAQDSTDIPQIVAVLAIVMPDNAQ